MSASRTKKERQAVASLGLTEKEKKALTENKAKHRRHVIYTICGVIAVIAVAVLLIWDSNIIQKNSTALTVADQKYNVVDMDYYYYSTYATYLSNATTFGIDTSIPLSEQEIYEGYSWDDMLKDSAKDYLTNIALLTAEAKAAGYELSQAGRDTVAEAAINISSYASLYGFDEEYYLKANYGKYITMSDYKRIYSDYMLAKEYASVKQDSFDASDADIDALYAESPVQYDTYDYYCYLFPFSTTETDENGNRVDLDEATIEANRADAETKANEVLDLMNGGKFDEAEALATEYGATNDSNLSAISSSGYKDFMNMESTQAGSSAVVENVSSVSGNTIGYFAIYVNDRYLDDYKGANIRVIATPIGTDTEGNKLVDECMSSTQAILDEFESTGMTSDDFAAVCNNHSSDVDTYPGGLRENVSKRAYNDEITSWIFDSARKQGDYSMFMDENAGASYIVFYEGSSDTPYWRTSAAMSIKATAYDNWIDEATANCTVTEGFGIRYVGLK